MNKNIYKKMTFEDKFARNYYCSHARLNSIRFDKKYNRKDFRRKMKKDLTQQLKYDII